MNWEIQKIEDMCSRITSGGTPSRKNPEYFGGSIPWVKTKELNDSKIATTEESINEMGLNNSSAKLLPKDTVLLAMYGATVGQLGMLSTEMTCNQACCALIVDESLSDPRFMFYLLLANRENVISAANGAAQQNLSARNIAQMQFAFPPLVQQCAIADVLGALDDKIAANQRAQESGLDLIKALWQKAQRTSTNEVLVGDIIEVNPRTQLADTPEVAFLDMKNLPEDGHLPCTWEMKESRSGSKFLNGDTLLGRITPCFENRKLGYVDFLEEGEAGLGSTEFIVFRPKENTPRAIPLCIASSDSFRSEAQLNMVGTSGRQRVTADFVKQFPVRWPTTEVLHDFNEATSPLLEKFSLLTKENQVLAATRDELLPLLMNGKITVAEAKEAAGDVDVVKQNKQEEGDGSV